MIQSVWKHIRLGIGTLNSLYISTWICQYLYRRTKLWNPRWFCSMAAELGLSLSCLSVSFSRLLQLVLVSDVLAMYLADSQATTALWDRHRSLLHNLANHRLYNPISMYTITCFWLPEDDPAHQMVSTRGNPWWKKTEGRPKTNFGQIEMGLWLAQWLAKRDSLSSSKLSSLLILYFHNWGDDSKKKVIKNDYGHDSIVIIY